MAIFATCRLCQNSGTVVAIERATTFIYGFACSCQNGGKFRALPKWGDFLRSRFIPDCDRSLNLPDPTPAQASNPEPF
jgi:hypothetical protein